MRYSCFMRLRPEPITPENIAFIEAAIRDLMGPYAVREVRIRPGDDHDGDPVIFVDIDHDLSPKPIVSKAMRTLSKRVLDHLWSAGEDRFAHVRHHFHADQPGSWDR